MFFRLLLLFTVVPLAELALLIRVGELVGVGATIGLVILTGLLGAWLTRLEGARVLRRVRAEMEAGRVPTDQLLDGMLVLVAGAVLLTPGLITDAIGFFLLIPAGRRRVRRTIAAALARRFEKPQARVIDADWRRDD